MDNKKKGKLTSFDLVIKVMCVFPILTSLINQSNIIKILFVFFFLSCVMVWVKNGIKKRTCIGLVILVAHYIFVVLNTRVYPGPGLNMFFYYPFSIIFMMIVIDYKEELIDSLIKNRVYIRGMMKLWTAIVGISIFLPSCYYVKEGGTRFFGSFARTIFRLGPSALFIMSIVAVSMTIYNRKKDIVFSIVPLYCFFMGSSRTYLVVGLLVFIVLWYWYCQKKKYFFLSLIPLILAALFMALNTSIGDKILYTMDENQYGDFWFRITSSRSLIWDLDIKAWKQEAIQNRLFGGGFFFTHFVAGLWAHNDFIELLCSVGVFGLLFFLFYHFRMIKVYCNEDTKVPFFVTIACLMSWLFNAMFNMYYVYFCAFLAFPVLLLAIKYFYSTDEGKEKRLI